MSGNGKPPMLHIRVTEEERNEVEQLSFNYKNKLGEREKSIQYLAHKWFKDGIQKESKAQQARLQKQRIDSKIPAATA